jgi:hypothetical protein
MNGDSGGLRDLRSLVCHLAADWLAGAGDSVWVSAWAAKDRDVEAVALVTQMVGQLGQEAATRSTVNAGMQPLRSPGKSLRLTISWRYSGTTRRSDNDGLTPPLIESRSRSGPAR